MTPSIRIDPKTGSKSFSTRASKATDKIAGKGYSTTKDDALKTLPPQPSGAVFDAKEQAKYRAFKEARLRQRCAVTEERLRQRPPAACLSRPPALGCRSHRPVRAE